MKRSHSLLRRPLGALTIAAALLCGAGQASAQAAKAQHFPMTRSRSG
ncbi:hypothetical protein ACU4HD_35275 [Cupriavidus basilensis]